MKTRILTAVIAAACVIIAGCSTTPETPDPPTVTLAPSPDPTEPAQPETEVPTPFPTDQLPERLADLVTKPVLPDDANEFTADGAAAFAQFVIDATNWAYAIGDVEPLRKVCDEGSYFCQSVKEHAPAFSTGDRIRFGGLDTIEINEINLYADNGDALIMAGLIREPYKDFDQEGSLLSERPAEEGNVILHLEMMNGEWQLLGMARE